MSCRLPGAPDPDAFWRLLREGRDAITETPAERSALLGLPAPTMRRPACAVRRVPRAGRPLRRARSSGSRRARRRRWTRSSGWRWSSSWEALEDAGIAPDALARQPDRRLRRRHRERLRRARAARGRRRGRPPDVHRHAAQHHRQPRVVRARPARAEPDGRHRTVVVARRRPPGLPEPALRRVDARAGGRRAAEPRPAARAGRCPSSARCRPTGAASRSTPGPTGSSAARAAASSCSSRSSARSPTATRSTASSAAAPSTTTAAATG